MLYINPSVDPKTQPVVFKPFLNTSFPSAIGYLAGHLRAKCGDKPVIHDEQISWLTKKILREKMREVEGPKLAGLTCLTGMAKRTYELTKWIKEIDPEFCVLLGGVHATALPEEALTVGNADIVVKGEGEETLREIYSAVQQGKGIDDVIGIAFKRENGEIVNNCGRPLVPLAQITPFPFDLFEEHIDYYKDFGTIMSSRGCPYDCSFCSQRLVSGRKFRFLSNERVVGEIKLLVDKYHQRKIFFVDDVFTVNKKRCMSLLQAIIDSGYHKKIGGFVVESRGSELDRELLEKMKEANVISIAMGMETGSERMMLALGKGATVKCYVDAIKLAHEVGIGTDASLIFGLPTETAEERKMTANLVRMIPLDGARFNCAIPYPSTRFFNIAVKEGRLNKKEDWVNFSNQHYMTAPDLPYTPIGTTKTELVYDTFMANLRFSLRPKVIREILFSLSSGGTVFSVKQGWYKKPKMLISLAKLGLFLSWKSVTIIFKRGLLELGFRLRLIKRELPEMLTTEKQPAAC